MLVVSRDQESLYDCDFKIADLGLAHFKRHVSSPQDATSQDRHTTNAYGDSLPFALRSTTLIFFLTGAPETYRSEGLENKHISLRQNTDIWSLGCIFSEVGTWVTEGHGKLLEYRRRRKMESGTTEDLFHWDNRVLQTVKQTHEDILENSRRNDHITSAVVQQMIPGMMEMKYDSRDSAKVLHTRSTRILEQASSKLGELHEERSKPHPSQTVSDSSVEMSGRRLPPHLPPGRHSQRTLSPEHQENLPASTPSSQAQPPTDLYHQGPPFMPAQGLFPRKPRQLNAQYSQYDARANAQEHDISQAEESDPLPSVPEHNPAYPRRSNTQRPSNRPTSMNASMPADYMYRSSTVVANVDDQNDNPPAIVPFRHRENKSISHRQGDRVSSMHAEASQNMTHNSPGSHRDSNLFVRDATASPTTPKEPHPRSPPNRHSPQNNPERPKMLLEHGLMVKKAIDGGKHLKYLEEDKFEMMNEVLKKRDHVRSEFYEAFIKADIGRLFSSIIPKVWRNIDKKSGAFSSCFPH